MVKSLLNTIAIKNKYIAYIMITAHTRGSIASKLFAIFPIIGIAAPVR